LIPEFYSSPDFLRNSDGIQLGRRQDGTRLGNVVLPPWAVDEDDFVKKHRNALESEFVSQNLHQWIDLIFGYKQRGDNAVKADNVFHPLTYEGAVNLDDINDPMERMAILMQINEFGQTPHQIFNTPHPQRFARDEREKMMKSASLAGPASNGSTPPSSRGGSFTGSTPPSRTNSGGSSSLSGSIIEENAPRSILTSSFGTSMRSRGSQEDNLGQMGMMTPTRNASRTLGTPGRAQEQSSFADSFGDLLNSPPSLGESPILELSLAGLSLSSVGNPSIAPARSAAAELESDDSTVWGSVENLKASDSFRLHRDVVTSVSLSPNGQTMFSVSQDSTLKIYSLADSKQLRSISISQLALSSCVLTGDGSSVIISSWDNSSYCSVSRLFSSYLTPARLMSELC
jgi:factor associated with neutral sphingomyelinase activation